MLRLKYIANNVIIKYIANNVIIKHINKIC